MIGYRRCEVLVPDGQNTGELVEAGNDRQRSEAPVQNLVGLIGRTMNVSGDRVTAGPRTGVGGHRHGYSPVVDSVVDVSARRQNCKSRSNRRLCSILPYFRGFGATATPQLRTLDCVR